VFCRYCGSGNSKLFQPGVVVLEWECDIEYACGNAGLIEADDASVTLDEDASCCL
jgi:hypothetical protein